MPARPALVGFALVLLLAAGCGPAKLNESRTYTVEPGDAQALDLPAVAKPQTITVEFKSTASDVSVLIYKEADAKGDDGLLGSDPAKALAQKTGKDGTLTAEVPENTATRIIVRQALGKTDVTLKVTNSK